MVELYAESFLKCLSPRSLHSSAVISNVMMAQNTGVKVAVQSLADFPATAALGKELIFHGHASDVADLGAGSGILGVCAAIGALRSGKDSVTVHCLERQPELTGALKRLALQLRPRISLLIEEADITSPDAIKALPLENIGMWVSETIRSDTIPICIEDDSVHLGDGPQFLDDPFPKVLRNLVHTVPEFLPRVRTGALRFFPDIINGKYVPDGKNGTLILQSSQSHKEGGDLRTVGRDFKKITSKKAYRWP